MSQDTPSNWKAIDRLANDPCKYGWRDVYHKLADDNTVLSQCVARMG